MITMTDFNTIELEKDPRCFATLWLSRPEKNNAFNAEMIRELIIALETVKSDDNLRFLLLRGRGRHFSAGTDLQWMQQIAELDFNANFRDARELANLMYTLDYLEIPTLAVVQGAAFGGALGLISCSDMAIGSEDALLSLSEVRNGLAPAVISPFVVRAIGERSSRRYSFTAERSDGKRARELGLLCECNPITNLDTEVEAWVGRMLQNSPAAMRASKVLLHEAGTGELTPDLRLYTEKTIAHLCVSAKGQEGLRAFLDKRQPA